MKKLYIIIQVLLVICVAGSVIFLIFTPGRVPVHYNFSGEADRIGSKYENLIMPAVTVIMGLTLMYSARSEERKKGEKSNVKLLLYVDIIMISVLTVIGFFLMYKAMKYEPGSGSRLTPDGINRLVSISIGVLLIIIGNVMPKARRNSTIGIRTKWSLANDRVWQKSQRFGGIASVAGGFCMIILALFIKGTGNIIMTAAVMTALVIASTVMSYRYWKADKEENN